jgi:hypothetical protein
MLDSPKVKNLYRCTLCPIVRSIELSIHALDLLRVLLGLLELWGDQLLQVLHLVRQVYSLSLTHL